jgi:hypothetical protein
MSTRKLELTTDELQALGLQHGDVFQGTVQDNGRIMVTVQHDDSGQRRMTGREFCDKWRGPLGRKSMTPRTTYPPV